MTIGGFREFARRTDQNFAEIKQELRLVRDDLKQEIHATREELKQEIRGVGDKLQAFADRTDANFKPIEAKYGEIS
ncbi:MAG: hypothetical protein NZ517_00645 [Candidatus Nitrosocaldus sp.]|nr:hypothetical protein [Candidatus Nitrosocaldus sp.]MDW8000135.1 hypothetical protein [Candidatus Nitrosocaldus sp.]